MKLKNTNLSPPNRDLLVSQHPALQESLHVSFQRGTYVRSASLRLSYSPRWMFRWHVSQTGICFRFNIRRMRFKPDASLLLERFRICRTWCMTIGWDVSPQMQQGHPSLERVLILAATRTWSMSETFPLWNASRFFVQSWFQ